MKIDFNSNISNITSFQRKNKIQKKELSNFNSYEAPQKPIKFKEGVDLVAKGYIDKAKNIVKSMVKHPFKTLGIVALTSLLFHLAPLMCISSITLASAFSLIYGAIAIAKTTKHTSDFIKDNKKQDYNNARQDLKNIGSDALDLTLTLPFAKKSIENIKDYVKLGNFGVNHYLINVLKQTKGLKNKYIALKEENMNLTEDIQLIKTIYKFAKTPEEAREYMDLCGLPVDEFVPKVYEKMVKDMGYEGIAPDIILTSELDGATAGGFSNDSCIIAFNKDVFENMSYSEMITSMRHELEHFKQFADIARYKGVSYLPKMSAQYQLIQTKRGNKTPSCETNKIFIKLKGEKAFLKSMEYYINKECKEGLKTYQKVVDKLGRIKEGTKEAKQAQKYIEANLNYPDTTNMEIPTEEYLNNLLEVGANEASKNPEGMIGEFKKFSAEADKIVIPDTMMSDAIRASVQGLAALTK